jgi:hypothetical protein
MYDYDDAYGDDYDNYIFLGLTGCHDKVRPMSILLQILV